jgi:hypothetical protein
VVEGLRLVVGCSRFEVQDCELFIKWKGDVGGLQQIRGEKVGAASSVSITMTIFVCVRREPALSLLLQVPKFSLEEEALADKSAAPPPPSAVSGRVAQLMGGLGLRGTTDSDAMCDADL